MDRAIEQLLRAKVALETLAKLDISAYCRVMAAIRQPALAYPVARLRAISASLESAARVPLQIAEWAVHALEVARALLQVASASGVGDAGAGSYLLFAAGRAALDNVGVNTGSKLAAKGWRGWARAIDTRAAELLARSTRWSATSSACSSRTTRATDNDAADAMTCRHGAYDYST